MRPVGQFDTGDGRITGQTFVKSLTSIIHPPVLASTTAPRRASPIGRDNVFRNYSNYSRTGDDQVHYNVSITDANGNRQEVMGHCSDEALQALSRDFARSRK
jgi:hypothetical protein